MNIGIGSQDLSGIQMMDSSVNIPQELIIRSLPLNVELIDLIKQQLSYNNQTTNTAAVEEERKQGLINQEKIDIKFELYHKKDQEDNYGD